MRLFSLPLPIVLLVAALLAPLLGLAPHARADAGRDAREHYERALSLYEEGAYDAAMAELKRAAELRPSYKLIYNMALVQVAQHDFAAATGYFKEYLAQGGNKLPKARVDAVNAELARLEHLIGRLRVEADVTGATVQVDGMPVGTTPLAEPLLVNSGTRRITLSHPDYAQQEQRITIAGRSDASLRFQLAPKSKPPAVAVAAPVEVAPAVAAQSSAAPHPLVSTSAPQRTDHAQLRRKRRLLIIPWVATGALALGAGAAMTLAYLKDNKLGDAREKRDADANDLQALSNTVQRSAIAADVLTGATVVAAAVSLGLTIKWRNSTRDDRASARSVRLVAQAQGIRLSGTF